MFRAVPLSIIRSFSLYTREWYMSYRFADSLTASRIRTELQFRPDPATKLYDIYHYCVYSEKLLMMDRGTVRNMYSSISKILFLEISASIWFYYKKVFCRFNVSSIYLFSLKTISVLRKMVRPNWMYMVLRHTHVSWCTAYSLIQNIINRS